MTETHVPFFPEKKIPLIFIHGCVNMGLPSCQSKP